MQIFIVSSGGHFEIAGGMKLATEFAAAETVDSSEADEEKVGGGETSGKCRGEQSRRKKENPAGCVSFNFLSIRFFYRWRGTAAEAGTL